MSELRENVFEMLDNDDNLIKQNEEENEKEKNNKDNNNKLNIDIERKDYNDNDNHINDNNNNNEDEEEDNSTWTDVSSSKVKKISSSSSTTKSENKDNNERGKSSPAVSNKSNNNNNNNSNNNSSTNTNNSVTSTNDNQTGSQEPTKKKVLRFTRDELLALHRPTKCLAEMVDIPEVVTVESLEPECNKPFDPDEILKIWNNDANKARESNGGRGRGRGRGRNGDGDDNTYSNHHKDDDAQDIWDDVDSANSKTFDLADFSAATFKFSESAIKLTENTELYSKEGDETMESLMKDDHDFSGSLEEEPTQPVQKSGNEKGRNLLLQTLAVKTSTTDQKSPAIPFKATVQASTDDTLLDELIEEDGVNLSTISGDLKNDDSLTFDSADDLDIDGIIGGLTATISATTISTTSTNTTPVQNAPIVSNQGAPTAINRVLNPQTQQVNQAAYIQQQQQAQQAQVQAQQNILLYNQQPGSQIPRQPVPSPARPQQQQPQQPVIVPVVPQPPPTLVPDKWIYRDPHGNIQGPFEMTAMRRWLESGYFKENLPIKMTRWTTFHPLGIVYPNPESAFLGLIHEPMLPNNPVVIHSIPPQMIPQQQQQQHMMQGIPQQQQPTQQQQQQQQQMSRTVEITPKQIDSDRLQSNDQGLNADDLIKGKRAIPKSAPSTLVVTTPLDKQDTINSNNSQIAAAVAAGSLTSNNSSSSTGVGVVAGTSSTNTTQQKTTKKVETISTTNVSTTTSKDSQNSNNDPSKQKPKQQSQPSQQSQSQQQQQQPQQSKPSIVTSTTASTNSSVTSESNNGDTSSNNNNNNNKKNDSQNANKKTKTTKKSSKDNTDGSDSSNNKKNDESSQPVQSAWTNKKGRDANEGKALSLTEIQQQEEAAKKQHAGESHPVENPPSSVRSFQLKNLLGVGGKEKGWSTNSTSNNNQSSNSLRDIQNEQEKINESKIAQQQQLHHQQQQQQQQQQQGRGSSQWKAPAGVSNNSGMKSLVEIMEEEKNASGSTQSETKAGRTGSWAAKAGGPKSSTESSSIPPNWIATQSQKNNELSISDNSDSKIPPSPGKRVVTVTNNTSNSNTSNIIKPNSSSSSSQSQSQQQSQNNNNNNNSKKSNSNSSNNSHSNSLAVGGDGIVEWSLLQLKRLSIENKSSTEDMALIEFCLTLKSAVEIREYLADYLGSTPQVSQFATEFIRRKEGKQPTQLRSTAGGTALTATILEKDKKNISLPTEAKKKKQKGKGQEF